MERDSIEDYKRRKEVNKTETQKTNKTVNKDENRRRERDVGRGDKSLAWTLASDFY